MSISDVEAEPKMEAWVSQVESRTSMGIEDLRSGRVRTLTVKGKGQVLRLTDQQRDLIEERITVPTLNPFRNGTLVQKGAKSTEQGLRDQDLIDLLALPDAEFNETLTVLTEINVRRLKALAPDAGATYNQVGAIKEFIEENWPIASTTQLQDEIHRSR